MKKKVIVIAEAGVNHNGDLNIAKKLIDVAAEAGADYVKFQTFKANKIVTKDASRAEYQNKNTLDSDSQYVMLKKLELTSNDHEVLKFYCKKKKIKFLSTAFDLDSLHYLSELNIKLAKIPSGEITNYPYLKQIPKLFSKVILSTGMSNIKEIKEAINVLLDNGLRKNNLTVLHCNTEYPTPMLDVNLTAMLSMKNELDVNIGYSDHTNGIEVAIAAVAMGANVIEKHFTLDKSFAGPDHKASLNPDELKNMINSIRNIEKAISGSGIKEPTISELKNKKVIRKSIVAIKPIKKGEAFSINNIGVKRPGTGISPMKWENVIGKISKYNFNKDQLIIL